MSLIQCADTAVAAGFGGQSLDGRGRQIQQQAFGDHERGLWTRRFVHRAALRRIVEVNG